MSCPSTYKSGRICIICIVARPGDLHSRLQQQYSERGVTLQACSALRSWRIPRSETKDQSRDTHPRTEQGTITTSAGRQIARPRQKAGHSVAAAGGTMSDHTKGPWNSEVPSPVPAFPANALAMRIAARALESRGLGEVAWTESDFPPVIPPQDDALLKKIIEECGPCNWSLIAQSIPGRSGKSCRLRCVSRSRGGPSALARFPVPR